jgi:hypothetical protein
LCNRRRQRCNGYARGQCCSDEVPHELCLFPSSLRDKFDVALYR